MQAALRVGMPLSALRWGEVWLEAAARGSVGGQVEVLAAAAHPHEGLAGEGVRGGP